MSMANRVRFENHHNDPEHRETGWFHYLMNGGSITVLRRMTGFGYMDIETGYRSPCRQFWLASGGHDIRDHLDEFDSEDEMINWVIDHANTCRGGHPEWRKVGIPLDSLLYWDAWRPE